MARFCEISGVQRFGRIKKNHDSFLDLGCPSILKISVNISLFLQIYLINIFNRHVIFRESLL